MNRIASSIMPVITIALHHTGNSYVYAMYKTTICVNILQTSFLFLSVVKGVRWPFPHLPATPTGSFLDVQPGTAKQLIQCGKTNRTYVSIRQTRICPIDENYILYALFGTALYIVSCRVIALYFVHYPLYIVLFRSLRTFPTAATDPSSTLCGLESPG